MKISNYRFFFLRFKSAIVGYVFATIYPIIIWQSTKSVVAAGSALFIESAIRISGYSLGSAAADRFGLVRAIKFSELIRFVCTFIILLIGALNVKIGATYIYAIVAAYFAANSVADSTTEQIVSLSKHYRGSKTQADLFAGTLLGGITIMSLMLVLASSDKIYALCIPPVVIAYLSISRWLKDAENLFAYTHVRIKENAIKQAFANYVHLFSNKALLAVTFSGTLVLALSSFSSNSLVYDLSNLMVSDESAKQMFLVFKIISVLSSFTLSVFFVTENEKKNVRFLRIIACPALVSALVLHFIPEQYSLLISAILFAVASDSIKLIRKTRRQDIVATSKAPSSILGAIFAIESLGHLLASLMLSSSIPRALIFSGIAIMAVIVLKRSKIFHY